MSWFVKNWFQDSWFLANQTVVYPSASPCWLGWENPTLKLGVALRCQPVLLTGSPQSLTVQGGVALDQGSLSLMLVAANPLLCLGLRQETNPGCVSVHSPAPATKRGVTTAPARLVLKVTAGQPGLSLGIFQETDVLRWLAESMIPEIKGGGIVSTQTLSLVSSLCPPKSGPYLGAPPVVVILQLCPEEQIIINWEGIFIQF